MKRTNLSNFSFSLCALLLVALAMPHHLHAQPVEQGLYFSQSAGASINPLGLLLDSRLLVRFGLSEKPGQLWESTKFEIGLRNELSPTDEHLALFATLVPIAFLEMTLKGGPYLVYDQLGFGYTLFDNYSADYHPDIVDTMNSSTQAGYWAAFVPVLKLKLKSVILMHSFTLNWLAIGTPGEFYLDRRAFVLHPTRGIDLLNESFLLYEFTKNILAGVTYRNAQIPACNFTSQRLCAMIIFNGSTTTFKRLYGVIMAGTYVQDRVLHLLPYGALKAGFDIQLK